MLYFILEVFGRLANQNYIHIHFMLGYYFNCLIILISKNFCLFLLQPVISAALVPWTVTPHLHPSMLESLATTK